MRLLLATLIGISAQAFAQQTDTFPVAGVTGGYTLKSQKTSSKEVICHNQLTVAISPDNVLWLSGLQIPVGKAEKSLTFLRYSIDGETVELTLLKKNRIKLVHSLETNGTSKRAECEYEKNKY